MKGFLNLNMKYKNYHYLLAQIFPLTLYFIFSLVGWGLIDSGFIILTSISIREGLLPYKDFFCMVTPLTFYIQAYLQKIFYFLSPITISIIWKGVSYSLLSLISLVYLIKLTEKLNFQIRVPLSFIYLYPLILMLVGPIHETHVGYTTDVLLFACLGVLLITWPIDILNKLIRLYSWLGYLFLGISFCFKQEIGIVAMLCGFIYLIVKRIVIKLNKMKENIFLDTLIPAILLLLPTVLFLIFFYLNSSLMQFIKSIFIIPSSIKSSILKVISYLISFGIGLNLMMLVASITFFILVIIILYLKDTNNFNDMANFFTFQKRRVFTKFLRYILSIGCFVIFFFFILNENHTFNYYFSKPTGIIFPVFYALYRIFFFFFIFALLALFIFLIVKLKLKIDKNWIIYYIMPIFLFFLIFNSSTLAGTSPIRMNRIVLPLFLIAFMLLLAYLSKYFENINLSWKTINRSIIILTFLFLSARTTGTFSAVLADPLHRPISYSSELNCFIDKEVYKNMKELKEIVGKNNEADIYAYQTDNIFYIFLDKKSVTYSSAHCSDTYPHYLDDEEIKSIKSLKVKFIITQSNHKREDSFLFRKDDPIRDYIEEHYKIVIKGKYFYLWEIKT